jgi:site-specific DNA-methyltransferase (adenine-specific)
VIWGANYFTLPSTRCVVCWDKCQPWPNFSQWEMAWTSFSYPAKLFKFDNRTGDKIHPTQKPTALYRWILEHFAKEGDKILDTHLGSGSIAIACHEMGFSLDAWEIDKDYCTSAKKRLETHQQQQQLW